MDAKHCGVGGGISRLGIAASRRRRKLGAMSASFAQRWADARRQLRLAARAARFGRSSWSGTPHPGRTVALQALYHAVNRWLRDLGVDYALAFGTLLGWHREGRILLHDRDVDFGLPVAAYDAVRRAGSRLPPGFTLHDTSHRHRGPKLYVNHGGWEADLYFYVERAGLLHSTEISPNPGDCAPFPRELFFPLQPAHFLGEATFVPAQPRALLEHHYRYLGADAVRDPVTRYFRPAS
jgi:hypothetical protein